MGNVKIGNGQWQTHRPSALAIDNLKLADRQLAMG